MQRWQLGPDVTVETEDADLASSLDVIFRALRSDAPPARRLISLRIQNQQLIAAGLPVSDLPPTDRRAPFLESLLTHYVAEVTSSEQGLHAGAVIIRDRLILLPGERGSGKTTASLHLGRQGVYLADDIVFVNPDSLAVRGFPKAGTLKAGSFPLFAECGISTTHHDPIRGPLHYLLPERHALQAARPDAIVFPIYEENAQLSVEQVEKPLAAFALVQQSFGRGPRRLQTAAKLAETKTWLIRHSSLADLSAAIGNLP